MHEMTILRALLIPALLIVMSLGPAFSAETQPVTCLMIGLEPHGDAGIYEETLQDIAANYPTVKITAVGKENLESLRIENLRKFDVLLTAQVQAENGDLPDYAKEGILQFLKDGGGLVVLHFAVANCQNWRDSIDLFGAMWVNGKSTHGPYHEFRVDVKDEAHPIIEGVKPFTTNDELYFNLLMRPDMHVIMTANEERFGHTVAEPMLCTHYVHNARCVYFALGHDKKSCSLPEFRKIIVQSIEWAACRR